MWRKRLNAAVVETLKCNLKLPFDFDKGGNYYKNLKGALFEKTTQLNNFYKKVTKIDEIKQSQQTVALLQKKHEFSIERKNEAQQELLKEIRHRSNEIRELSDHAGKMNGAEKFLKLLKEKPQIAQNEKYIWNKFCESERSERKIYAAYINAVKELNENERINKENKERIRLCLLSIAIYSNLLPDLTEFELQEDCQDVASKKNDEIPNSVPFEPTKENINTDELKIEKGWTWYLGLKLFRFKNPPQEIEKRPRRHIYDFRQKLWDQIMSLAKNKHIVSWVFLGAMLIKLFS